MSTKAIVISSTSSAILAAALIFPFIPSTVVGVELQDNASQRLEELADAVGADQTERKALSRRVDALLDRMQGVEALVEQRREREIQSEATPQAAGPEAGSSPSEASGKKWVTAAEFKLLMTKVLGTASDESATPDEQQRFWEACRSTTLVDDSIESLERELADSPRNTDLRMDLGNAYVAKLLTVASGPERGIWGMKAEKQWLKVVEQDPDHWDAQYTIAFSHSMYPEFLNKTDSAIKGFERALEIQSRVPPKAQHAKTYVHLARMLKRKGNIDRARKLLAQGQLLYPESQEIKSALQSMQGK